MYFFELSCHWSHCTTDQQHHQLSMTPPACTLVPLYPCTLVGKGTHWFVDQFASGKLHEIGFVDVDEFVSKFVLPTSAVACGHRASSPMSWSRMCATVFGILRSGRCRILVWTLFTGQGQRKNARSVQTRHKSPSKGSFGDNVRSQYRQHAAC